MKLKQPINITQFIKLVSIKHKENINTLSAKCLDLSNGTMSFPYIKRFNVVDDKIKESINCMYEQYLSNFKINQTFL